MVRHEWLCSMCTREAWFSKQLTPGYGRKLGGNSTLTISNSAIGGSEARSTSRQNVSRTNARQSRGIGWYNSVTSETIPGWVKCQTCTQPQARQPLRTQAGQTPGSDDSGSELGDVHHLAPAGHLRETKVGKVRPATIPRSRSIEALDLPGLDRLGQVTSFAAASAGRTLKKVSPEASSRFVGETIQQRGREQLARIAGGGLRTSDDHYRSKRLSEPSEKLRSRQLMDGSWQLEGPRHQLRQVMRELKLVMGRANLVPVEGDYSSYGLHHGVTRVRNQDREVVRNIRAFYNHRHNMQSMRIEVPGWVVETLAMFQLVPHCLAYAVFRAGATPFEVWKWYKSPKPSYECKVIMHDHRVCGECPQGELQKNCVAPSGGVLVDRSLLAYLREVSAMQTRDRNLFVVLLAKCSTYKKLYAVSDVCMARIKPGTVMAAYMFSKEEELALSMACDTATGDNLMRATNRQMGRTIRFMPHRNWREALYFGGFSGWYHHVTGGTTVVGNR